MRCCGKKWVDFADWFEGLSRPNRSKNNLSCRWKRRDKSTWKMLSRSWTPGPSEDINPQVTRDAGNSTDQSYIFSFYLPFLGFLRWVRLYLCSQESFANDFSTGCLSYFCILGEYGHRIPLLGESGHRVPFLLLYCGWVLAQDTFFVSLRWVSISTGHLSYFCMLGEHRAPILLLYVAWVWAQGAFLISECWVSAGYLSCLCWLSLGTRYLSYFRVCFRFFLKKSGNVSFFM